MLLSPDLKAHLSRLQTIMLVRFPPFMDRARVARTIRELYTTQSANSVLLCVAPLFPEGVMLARETVQRAEKSEPPSSWHPPRPPLPDAASIQNGAARLLEAGALQKGHEAVAVLVEMGIIALCPSFDQ